MPLPRWEILVGQLLGWIVGLALIAGGVALWLHNPGPTIQTVTVVTVTGTHHLHEKTVTTTLNGPAADAAKAKSPDAVPHRSAAVTAAMVASGALLVIAASWLPRLRSLIVVPKPAKAQESDDDDDAADDDDDQGT